MEIPDQPGGLAAILNLLAEHNINLEYTYAFISRKVNEAYMVFRVEDTDAACEVLAASNVKLVSQEEMYNL
ncbi:hypothetical protein SDC9_130841 [bioreactor metagenome]|uniref:ACT domain-containing protein n=1 Tax=bioreactor metagenome TaxID=1076179 RepID=A0A645D568_9ZZZZ